MRIVLDTNTLISAIGWKDSKPREIFDGCLTERYELMESIDLLKEFLKVIQRSKFDFISEEDKKEFLISLMNICIITEPGDKIGVIKEDVDDNIVLECAFAGKADFIISGDEHLLKLKEYEGIKIVSSSEFLDLKG